MQYMGFTINNITMIGLILAIGIVIDDAVVVHENIFRHMEEYGKDAVTAARDGTKEIALAVMAFVALVVLGFAVHLLFSPWLLIVAVAIVAWIKFRPGRSRR